METQWIHGLVGGLLIGLAAAAYLLVSGRIAGMSGMLANVFGQPLSLAGRESGAFLLGAALGPVLLAVLWRPVEVTITDDVLPLVVGGLMVGYGVSLANGCTSGHGVCGLSRLSVRSLAATATFMGGTALMVYVLRHLIGGQP